jgi:subtilisin family serine protease
LLVVSMLVVSMIGAGQIRSSPPQRAPCPGDYAPGIVLVGFEDAVSGLRSDDPTRSKLGPLELNVAAKIPAISVVSVRVPVGQECAALSALRQKRGVTFAELDYAVRAAAAPDPDDPEWPAQWGPAKINAPSAWSVTTGTSDVVVAVLDTGARLSHEDLTENLWTNPGEIPKNGIDDDVNGKVDDFWGWHFFHEWAWNGTEYAYLAREDNRIDDDNGHGTHVSGIAGAEINNGVGIAGMAGGSRLMMVKVLDQYGNGWYSDLAQGIVYAVDSGADVINLSVGGRFPSESLRQAVDYAHAHGVLAAAAVGNVAEDGYDGVLYPAAYEDVLAVTATDQSDAPAAFSNYGPEVDVGAPGKDIYSTWHVRDYLFESGTSMAAPHASGLAALVWSARPDLTVAQVTEIITNTAADVNVDTQPGWDEYLGWGRIDAGRALWMTTHTGDLRLVAADSALPVGGTTSVTATLPLTAGAPVPLTFSASGGTVEPDVAVTMEGAATTTLVAGPLAGTAVITASTGTLTGGLSVRLLPGPAVSGTLTSSAQQCMPGQEVSLTLRASDRFGNAPLDGTAIDWRSDGGTVTPPRSSFRGGEGRAAFTPNGVRDTATITASWSGEVVVTTTVDVIPFAYHVYLPAIYHQTE